MVNTRFRPNPMTAAAPGAPGLFYELNADLAAHAEGLYSTWFEIALHAELKEYQPPDHPASREALEALMELAESLIVNARPLLTERFDLSHAYYTVHAPEQFESATPMMARSISLVFQSAKAYRAGEEPGLLRHIEGHLRDRCVPRLQPDEAGFLEIQ
jgi:hypothetical protein